jgi:hypothetical protein
MSLFIPVKGRNQQRSLWTDSLHQLLRAKGYPFLCKELCSDLLSNAVDTTKITERRRKDRSKEDTRSLINKAASGNL